MTIHDDLREVMGLFRETSGQRWAAEGVSVVHDPDHGVYRGHVADCVEMDDAAFMVACHELIRQHGPALLARQEGDAK